MFELRSRGGQHCCPGLSRATQDRGVWLPLPRVYLLIPTTEHIDDPVKLGSQDVVPDESVRSGGQSSSQRGEGCRRRRRDSDVEDLGAGALPPG